MNDRPVGIFDSGIGGLTVMRAIRDQLPGEDLIYLGDTARVPYGNKSAATIIRYALEDTRFLLSHGVKMIVVACNTASALAAPALREAFPSLPVLGMIGPGARAAAAATRNRRIGVIATAGTIGSGAYERRLREVIDGPVEIFSVPCPLFVPLVEEGELASPIARAVVAKYLVPLRDRKIDTLVLGCTHYPLLKPVIAECMGPGVTLVDSAAAAARETAEILATRNLLRDTPSGREEFHVTDAAAQFQSIAAAFLGHPPASLSLATLTE